MLANVSLKGYKENLLLLGSIVSSISAHHGSYVWWLCLCNMSVLKLITSLRYSLPLARRIQHVNIDSTLNSDYTVKLDSGDQISIKLLLLRSVPILHWLLQMFLNNILVYCLSVKQDCLWPDSHLGCFVTSLDVGFRADFWSVGWAPGKYLFTV